MAFKTQHLPSPPQYLSIEDIKSAFKSCSIPFSSPCNLGPVPPNKDFTYCSIKIPQSLTFWVWNRGAEKNKERNKQTDQKKKNTIWQGGSPSLGLLGKPNLSGFVQLESRKENPFMLFTWLRFSFFFSPTNLFASVSTCGKGKWHLSDAVSCQICVKYQRMNEKNPQ